MLRRIITIDEEKCNGCGLCVDACHEGAIGLKNGKAVLLRDDYCDGLGDCLPACPVNAISFEEREALPYDEAAVQATMALKQKTGPGCACPGSAARPLRPLSAVAPGEADAPEEALAAAPSQLRQWPVQLKLVPVAAPYFSGADLLLAADCAAYAHGNFHAEFMRGAVTLIGCPKLDGVDYSEKLGEILQRNDVKSLTVVRMSVPCCGGIEQAAMRAMGQSGKSLPLRVVTLTPEGVVLP